MVGCVAAAIHSVSVCPMLLTSRTARRHSPAHHKSWQLMVKHSDVAVCCAQEHVQQAAVAVS